MNQVKTSLQKSKIKFVLFEGVNESAVKSLRDSGYENIDYIKTAMSGDELIERVSDAHFIGLRSRTQLLPTHSQGVQRIVASRARLRDL